MNREPSDEKKLLEGILMINVKMMGLIMGLLCGLVIFLATIWLVIKGGHPVGPHLSLLSQYFWGYRVSVAGSFIGFAYGFIMGAAAGFLVGWIYNKVVDIKT